MPDRFKVRIQVLQFVSDECGKQFLSSHHA